MKIFKSNLYGDIPQPDNFEELIDLITLEKGEYRIVHMWRGHSNIEWRIDHAAYRRLKIDNKGKVTEQYLIEYELFLLSQATHKGYRYQDGRVLSDFELLAKLQHHGAATRLLDFTRNALIAAWFCISSDLNKTGLLIGLHAHHLGGFESQGLEKNYEDHINEIMELPHPQTWEPPVVKPRIAAQHSQFIYSALSDDPKSSICLSKSENVNIFIAISPKLKSSINKILEVSFDLRFQTLFPDIDGFGNSNSHRISTYKMSRW